MQRWARYGAYVRGHMISSVWYVCARGMCDVCVQACLMCACVMCDVCDMCMCVICACVMCACVMCACVMYVICACV